MKFLHTMFRVNDDISDLMWSVRVMFFLLTCADETGRTHMETFLPL